MHLTFIRSQLDGELIFVMFQHQLPAHVKGLTKNHMTIVCHTDLNLLTEQFQTAEDRTLLITTA